MIPIQLPDLCSSLFLQYCTRTNENQQKIKRQRKKQELSNVPKKFFFPRPPASPTLCCCPSTPTGRWKKRAAPPDAATTPTNRTKESSSARLASTTAKKCSCASGETNINMKNVPTYFVKYICLPRACVFPVFPGNSQPSTPFSDTFATEYFSKSHDLSHRYPWRGGGGGVDPPQAPISFFVTYKLFETLMYCDPPTTTTKPATPRRCMNFVTLFNFRLLDQIRRPYEDLVDACFSGAAQSWPLETFYFEEELESFRQLLVNDTGYFTFLSRNIWEDDSIFFPRALVILD